MFSYKLYCKTGLKRFSVLFIILLNDRRSLHALVMVHRVMCEPPLERYQGSGFWMSKPDPTVNKNRTRIRIRPKQIRPITFNIKLNTIDMVFILDGNSEHVAQA